MTMTLPLTLSFVAGFLTVLVLLYNLTRFR